MSDQTTKLTENDNLVPLMNNMSIDDTKPSSLSVIIPTLSSLSEKQSKKFKKAKKSEMEKSLLLPIKEEKIKEEVLLPFVFECKHKGQIVKFELRKNCLMYVDLNDIPDEEEDEEVKKSYSSSDDSGSDTGSDNEKGSSSSEDSDDEIIQGFTTLNLFHNSKRNLYESEKVLKCVKINMKNYILKTFGVKVKLDWADEDRQAKNICNFEVFHNEDDMTKNVEMIKKHPFVTTDLEVFWYPLFQNRHHLMKKVTKEIK